MPRQTADVIALILAGVVAAVVIATTVALLIEGLFATEPMGTGEAADFVSKVVGVLVGALVGYMAGRQIKENGH